MAAGNLVQVRWENITDGQLKTGVDRIVVMSQATIRGDKIATWAIQQDLSDAQTLKWQQIQQAAAAASAKPSAS